MSTVLAEYLHMTVGFVNKGLLDNMFRLLSGLDLQLLQVRRFLRMRPPHATPPVHTFRY